SHHSTSFLSHSSGDHRVLLSFPTRRSSDLRLRADLAPATWRAGTARAGQRLCLPHVDERALAGLKFSEALPRPLAEATLAARLRSEEHTSELQSRENLVCRPLLEKKKN